MKRNLFYRMTGVAILSLVFLGIGAIIHTYANQFQLWGRVVTPHAWTGGYVQKVWFYTGHVLSGTTPSAYFDQNGKLYGFFWLGSAGWATFSDGTTSFAQIQCPDNIWGNLEQKCPVRGQAWSRSSGWTILSGSQIGGGHSGVYFDPNLAQITGFGWNKGLGWIPFITGVYAEDDDLIPPHNPSNPNPIGGVGVNFIGKVAVIGNIAGTKVFEVVNSDHHQIQQPGYVYSTVRHAEIINAVRRNISLLIRNTPPGQRARMAEPSQTPFNYIYQEGKDYCINQNPSGEGCLPSAAILDPSLPDLKEIRSLVVVGGDIVLRSSFNAETVNQAEPDLSGVKAIIALKDENGRGGNVILNKDVKHIYSYIVAEGTVYSGEKTGTGIQTYASTGGSMFGVPLQQLYVNGLIISKNTIGGASLVGDSTIPRCPVLVASCSVDTAMRYDMGFFRNYDPNITEQSSIPEFRRGLQPRIKNATMIIDYNNFVLSNPPPGLQEVW